MKQLLARRKTMTDRFRLPLTHEDAINALTWAVQTEVEFRRGEFKTTPEMAAQLSDVARWLTSDSRSFGLLLCGNCGNGKTTLVKAFQNLINQLCLKRQSGNYTYQWGMRIMTAREIADICKADYKAFLDFCREPMLAIDDLGMEPVEISSYKDIYTPLIDMINKRYADQLFTIITSNLTPKEIGERYKERTADRLSEMMHIIEYTNPSFRY